MTDNTITPQINIFPEIKIILIIFVLCFLAFFRPHLKVADQVGYYSWVRSFVIDRDLDIQNEFEHFGSYVCYKCLTCIVLVHIGWLESGYQV